jgi:putative restriction endonuclease
MRGYVGVTDQGWYQFLRARADLTEVNFWRPGSHTFSALSRGEPFVFKHKAPYNAIGASDLYAAFEPLAIWHAWDVFGQAKGTSDEFQLLERLRRITKDTRLVERSTA